VESVGWGGLDSMRGIWVLIVYVIDIQRHAGI